MGPSCGTYAGGHSAGRISVSFEGYKWRGERQRILVSLCLALQRGGGPFTAGRWGGEKLAFWVRRSEGDQLQSCMQPCSQLAVLRCATLRCPVLPGSIAAATPVPTTCAAAEACT
jgi:hypothetical protein